MMKIRLDRALCRYRTKASIDEEIRFILVLFTKHPDLIPAGLRKWIAIINVAFTELTGTSV